ncbi:MAG: tetratricopeptide repeat protein, partial [Alphaproteobacteria bacterium]
PTSGAAIFPVVTRIAAENPAENPDENPDAIAAGIRAYEVKDYARAHDLWRPLAEAGQPMAQFHLGALYFEGRGVTRDLDEAQIWLARALGQGVTRARFLLGRVERGMAKAG